MQPALRQACFQASLPFQLRSKSSASGAWQAHGNRSQSRRERRIKRQAQNHLLKHICSQADWSFQSPCSQAFRASEAHIPDTQLWHFLHKGRDTSRRARRGWVKWLKQGGSAQRGREQARHSTWSHAHWGERWQEASGKRHSSEEWQSWGRQHRHHFAESFYARFCGYQEPEYPRQQTADAGSGQDPSCHTDRMHAKSLRLLGIGTSRGLTSAKLGEAFRACALAWHPDRHVGAYKHAAEARFKEVQAAYTVLRSLCAG
ncbi:g7721 [Coccomyxa viridis]|uniref:G7721 protein n=1 Tax=Coccomyxa viridis TaxID=1274662 RepID=A0ABP1FZQ3_9CHLO